MQYRSTTDEMLAARFDPEPFVDATGRRYAHPSEFAVGTLDPRPEFIPSRFTTRALGQLWELPRSEPNPILVELRKHWQPGFEEEEEIQMALESTAGTPEQIEHARKVLTRLANIYKEV